MGHATSVLEGSVFAAGASTECNEKLAAIEFSEIRAVYGGRSGFAMTRSGRSSRALSHDRQAHQARLTAYESFSR